MKTISLIGNMEVPFSSESHYKWTFQKLGWNVISLQENRTSSGEVIRALEKSDCLMWVHTHGWGFAGEDEVLRYVKENNFPSFSYHLDKYFGISSREGGYLSHPSFRLRYFFSTDGGCDEKWKEYGINHKYLPPGVVEYGAHFGVPNSHDACDLLFTGSFGYHAEYPFRPQMIEALRANYGSRFKVRTGIREEPLNNLYASARVCVGDHIFAGCPMYVSDRLFETVGRGGFIIYPDTPGVTDLIPGLVTYAPQDSADLIRKIDYYLDLAHEPERLNRRSMAFEYVRDNGTYTNRLTEILQVMGL